MCFFFLVGGGLYLYYTAYTSLYVYCTVTDIHYEVYTFIACVCKNHLSGKILTNQMVTIYESQKNSEIFQSQKSRPPYQPQSDRVCEGSWNEPPDVQTHGGFRLRLTDVGQLDTPENVERRESSSKPPLLGVL